MKKIVLILVALSMVFLMPLNVIAKETREVKEVKEVEEKVDDNKINVYLFWGNGCGYCEAAKEFFANIDKEYSKYFNLVDYEVWYNEDNNALKEEVAAYFKDDVTGVPYIVIGDETFGGYSSEYDADIKKAIKEAYEDEDYVDAIEKVKDGDVEAPKNYDTLIVIGIFVAIIGGFGALIYFSRK